jgi:hypothetical protein
MGSSAHTCLFSRHSMQTSFRHSPPDICLQSLTDAARDWAPHHPSTYNFEFGRWPVTAR